MINLRCSKWKVYYVYDYVPNDKEGYFNSNAIDLKNRIINYKNADPYEVALFTKDLMRAIATLTKDIMPKNVKNIGLVPVPSSKVDKTTVLKESIYQIKRWYEDGTAKQFGCDKNIYNYNNLLSRFKDVNTAHLGKRPTFNDHLESISCSENNLSNKYTTFIILDDITTTGISMNACKRILENHGAKSNYIYRLALARTVSNEDLGI